MSATHRGCLCVRELRPRAGGISECVTQPWLAVLPQAERASITLPFWKLSLAGCLRPPPRGDVTPPPGPGTERSGPGSIPAPQI